MRLVCTCKHRDERVGSVVDRAVVQDGVQRGEGEAAVSGVERVIDGTDVDNGVGGEEEDGDVGGGNAEIELGDPAWVVVMVDGEVGPMRSQVMSVIAFFYLIR